MNDLVPVTYYEKPMLKQPVWIWSVPVYFYAGGVTGAALVLSAVAQLADRQELSGIVRAGRAIGVVGHGVSSALLIIDLGRPERFMNMLRVLNTKSPLSIGSWVLAVGGTLSGASVVLPKLAGFKRLGDAAAIGAGVMGIPLAGYTGVLLGATAIPVWQQARRPLPILFMASAIASCASLLEIVRWNPREERIIHRFGVIGKAAELAGMAAVESAIQADPSHDTPLQTGLSGALWTASKALTVTSLAISLLPRKSNSRRLAGILGTLGGITLRFAVFYAGFASARDSRPSQ